MLPSSASACLFECRESLARCHTVDKLCHYYKALSEDEELYLEARGLYA